MSSLANSLARIVGPEHVHAPPGRQWLGDAAGDRGRPGHADAAVLPADREQVAEIVAWCYAHGVPIVPRGGGTGYAGGAVPLNGGVVVALERLRRVREPAGAHWRMAVEAGVSTAHVRRLAREAGLHFPPDPGAAEQSQIGGNVATNAGGPHAYKYGVTGAWVTGLEAVVAPGELITVGGPLRKDVAGYDLRSLLVGSEGTLGVITAVWLRLAPAPEAALPVWALYANPRQGCRAVAATMEAGVLPAALEYLDGATLNAARGGFPGELPERGGFLVIAEADGSTQEASRTRAELLEILGDGASATGAPEDGREIAALWRWRSGVSLAVAARRGAKLSEDITVPIEALAEAIERTLEIAARHRLEGCSWGHAGDANLHCTFMIDPDDGAQLARARQGAEDLYALAIELGGSISGEHGLGWIKRHALERQWEAGALRLHRTLKRALDPRGLLNPGKK